MSKKVFRPLLASRKGRRLIFSILTVQPSVEDDLQWKMTFGGRRPSVEDDLQWKMTFGGR